MKPKKKASKSDKSSQAKAKLPVEIRQYIMGRVVDISSASKYYKKSWGIYRPLLGSGVSEQKKDRYRLSDALYDDFLNSLSERLSKKFISRLQMKGGDWIADALCLSAYKIESPDGIDYDQLQSFPLWNPNRPVSDAWNRLGKLPVPPFEDITLEEPKSGSTWRPRQDCGIEISRVQVSRSFSEDPLSLPTLTIEHKIPKVRVRRAYSEDRTNLPTLTIELEGEPVCTLMKASYAPLDPKERELVIADAKQLWDSVVRWLASVMGVGQLQPGRPKTGLGWEAAYLHDHKGLSWKQVAQKVCPRKHRHDSDCKDNFRKQAEQYWKEQRRRIHRLPPSHRLGK